MTCDRFHIQLALLVGNDLDPREAVEVRQHLMGCPACQKRWSALLSSNGAIQSVARQSSYPVDRTSESTRSVGPHITDRGLSGGNASSGNASGEHLNNFDRTAAGAPEAGSSEEFATAGDSVVESLGSESGTSDAAGVGGSVSRADAVRIDGKRIDGAGIGASSLWPQVRSRLPGRATKSPAVRPAAIEGDAAPSWWTVGAFSAVCAAVIWLTVTTPVFDFGVGNSEIAGSGLPAGSVTARNLRNARLLPADLTVGNLSDGSRGGMSSRDVTEPPVNDFPRLHLVEDAQPPIQIFPEAENSQRLLNPPTTFGDPRSF